MTKHFQREVEKLKKKVLALGAAVEESFWRALKTLEERDVELAEKVIEGDAEIDRMEVDVEEECLKILALNQPVAVDLRFLVAVLKINNDLERIGDKACNIAKRAVDLASMDTSGLLFDFHEMGRKAQSMLKRSLDALVNLDTDLSREVYVGDEEVDAMHDEFVRRVKDEIVKKPERLEALIHYLYIARHLERVSDLATNIAEDVIYMVEGEIVRHRPDEILPADELLE